MKSIALLLTLTAVSCEYITSIVSSSANCKNINTVSALLKNESSVATCSQILSAASVAANVCGGISNTASFGSLGCSDSIPLEFATSSFPAGVEFIGFMTYSPSDSSCSKPLAGTFIIPDGTCKTPFWPSAFDLDPVKSYKVTVDAGSQNINLKTYASTNCQGAETANTVPGAFVNYCNNFTGTYALVVKGTGTASNSTDSAATTTTATTTTAVTKTKSQTTSTTASDSFRLQASSLLFTATLILSILY